MNCFKNIQLDANPQIVKYAREFIEQALIKDPMMVTAIIRFPDELLRQVNTELTTRYKFPELWYCRVYITPKATTQTLHTDTAIFAAINIPLFGGKDSKFAWYTGDYQLVEYYVKATSQRLNIIKWNGEPEPLDSIEMIEGSYLVRVDKPHQAIASEYSDRWIITMRFKGNPSFEELYDLIP